MPTIAGLRRRGYTPEAIRDFCARIGVAKKENVIDVALLEHMRARGPEPPRAAGAGRAAAAEGRHRELSGGPDRAARRGQQPRGPAAGHAAACRSRASSTSSATTSWKSRRRSSSACRPGTEVRLRYAYIIKCSGVVKDAAGDDRRAALHLRSRDAAAATRRRAAGEGRRSTGCRPRTRSTPRCGSTTGCSRRRIRARAAGDPLDDLNPQSLERRDRLQGRAVAGRGAAGQRASSSSAWATSASIPTRRPARRSSTAP